MDGEEDMIEGASTENEDQVETQEEIEQLESVDEGQKPSGVQKRIDELTREKWEARRAAQAAQDELNRLRAEVEALKKGEKPDDKKELTEEEVDRRATAKAQVMTEQEKFNARCNEAYERGRTAFEDFDAALGKFSVMGGLPPLMFQAVMELDHPERVLYELSKDLNQVENLTRQPPLRMAASLARIDERVKPRPAAPPKTAGAPPPRIRGGTASVAVDPSKLSMDDWMKHREKQVADRSKK